jgi:UV DNA damage endonuclease
MSENKPIQLGLCCLNIQLRALKPFPVFASRKMIIRTIKEKGIGQLKAKIIQNLKDVLTMMDWNEQNGIKVFRLSSELFPHKSNPKVEDYDFDFAKDLLRQIGEKSKKYNQRLTFHPGQYNVVGTPNKKTFQQTICDLKYHADVLDLMGLDYNSVMVVHGGGMYGDKEKTKDRWCEQFKMLPENVQKRLVLENCEKCFSIKDCIDVTKKINIPIVFDTHHYECYKIMHPEEEFRDASFYISDILDSWKPRNVKPKFHVSEQGSGRCGHHSDFIEVIPDYLLEIPEKYNTNIDIMIEAKKKELAIFKLYEKYPFLNCKI